MPTNPKKVIIGDPTTAQFILLASHGLRSPLTAIRWGLEALSKERLGKNNPAQQELAIELHRNAREMTSMLRSMILLSRMQSGVRDLRPVDVHIGTLLAQTIDNYASWATVRSVRCKVTCPTSLIITADTHLLEDIFSHILSLCIETADEKSTIEINATKQDDAIEITFQGLFLLPELRTPVDLSSEEENHQIVGGTPGLLLYLSTRLAESVDWNLQTECTENRHVCTISLSIPL